MLNASCHQFNNDKLWKNLIAQIEKKNKGFDCIMKNLKTKSHGQTTNKLLELYLKPKE